MCMFSIRFGLVAAVICSVSCVTGAERVVRVSVDGDDLTGQIVAHNRSQCWLVAGDGRLHGLHVPSIKDFQPLQGRLPVENAVTVRARLQEELGRNYSVMSSGRYVVAASPETVKQYLAVFDDIGRTFSAYFAKRSIPLENPRFPLVAIVFSSEREFVENAADEGVEVTRGLVGYYLRTSNRVTSYDAPSRSAASLHTPGLLPVASSRQRFAMLVPKNAAAPSISANVRDTLVHEATHQMAFNTGLHHRAGNDPKWVVEGLATVLEPAAVRENIASRDISSRVNADRLRWYHERIRPNWKSDALTNLIASDRPFTDQVLDAYALSWALTFYLNEAQPRLYASYLRRLKDRDPLEEYGELDRIEDFRSVFGRDLSRFEVDFLRFLDRLQ